MEAIVYFSTVFKCQHIRKQYISNEEKSFQRKNQLKMPESFSFVEV